jgi:hypothetical protein
MIFGMDTERFELPTSRFVKWGAPVADLIAPGIDDVEDHAANAPTPYFFLVSMW